MADFNTKYRDLGEDLEIDIHNLELEWRSQPMLLHNWNKLVAEASRLKDKAEEQYRVLKAELFGKARGGAFDFEGSATDAAINKWVEAQPKFKKALKRRNRAASTFYMVLAGKNEIETKAKSLEWETKLFLSNYYADSSELGKAQQEVASKSIREELNKGMKKKLHAIKAKKKKRRM